jgi:hypothetical protein
VPKDVQFWAYSEVANGAGIELIFDSDNDADPEGWDYYRYTMTVDWTGWRYFLISRADFRVARHPVGWHEINYVRFSDTAHEPFTTNAGLLYLTMITY